MIPEFKGELYSYDDAENRVPTAWKRDEITGNGWSRSERKCIAPKQLGHFERMTASGHTTWVYIQPNGYARPVLENWDKPEPPPLPRLGPYEQCGCGKPHNCTACGKPYWIELHGVADGFCTYCYNAG